MWAISERFARQLTTDQVRTTRVEVLTDPTASPIDVTDWWVDGSVDLGRNEIRRSCTLTFEDDGQGLVVPISAADLLAPYGNEVRVWSGFTYPQGDEELVPVGTFRIMRTTSRYPTVTIEGRDRAVNLQRNKWDKTRVLRPGMLWDDVVASLLLERYPAAELDLSAGHTDVTCPQVVIELGTDPWAWLQKAAADTLDCQLYADPMGVFRLLPEESVGADTVPVWAYDGRSVASSPPDEADWANTATYDQELDWATDEVWNAVVVTGTNKDNSAVTYYGAAYDTDPASPTWWNGKYGRNVLVETSDLVQSNYAASRAAKTRLQQVAGIPEGLTLGAIPNPALEVGDALLVRRPELGLDTVHLLDSAPLPLRAAGGPQRISTRVRRVVPEP